MQNIAVNRKALIKAIQGVKEDNISIMGVVMAKRPILEALKIQNTEEVVTITTGMLSWPEMKGKTQDAYHVSNYNRAGISTVSNAISNEPCIAINYNHTVMRFLNRPVIGRGQAAPKVAVIDLGNAETLRGKVVDAKVLLDAINLVTPAIAREHGRPVLECIFFESTGKDLTLTTADGFQLYTTTIPIEAPEGKWLISSEYLPKLIALLKGTHEVGLILNLTKDGEPKSLTLQASRQSTEIPCFFGTFPNYSLLIPKEGTPVTFSAPQVLEAIKPLKEIVKNGSGIIRLMVKAQSSPEKPGTLTVFGKSEEYGDLTVACNVLSETDCKVALNHSYLVDILKTIGEGKATMHIGTPSSPVKVTWDKGLIVVMPMFVQW